MMAEYYSFSELSRLEIGKPLLFTDGTFVIFLVLFLAVYQFTGLYSKGRTFTILFFSLLFYFINTGWFLGVIILSGIINYLLGRWLANGRKGWQKQTAIATGVFVNLAVLFSFKYSETFGQIVQLVSAGSVSLTAIIFPVGLSYYTFCNISYLVDVSRGTIPAEKSFPVYLAYISFFPTVQMGPIERAGNILPKLRESFKPDSGNIREGTLLIVNGLIKKMIIGDFLNHHLVTNIFSAPERFTGMENLAAALGYTLVIYCDFSGYTDIARGIAGWLGFSPALNFNLPYKSRNIGDFWRRWHISLSSWLRDYLFMPLALKFSKLLKSETVPGIPWLKSEHVIFWISTTVTFLACGIWHGTGINFVAWGLMHGLALSVWKTWNLETKNLRRNRKPLWRKVNQKTGVILTFIYITISWIIFRMPDIESSFSVFRQIGGSFHAEAFPRFITAYYPPLLMMAAGYTWHFLPDSAILATKQRLMNLKLPFLVILAMFLLVIIWYFQGLGSSQPIYINF